jgi:1-acyl-sn-glycerol-3-phosphate acyltransferase
MGTSLVNLNSYHTPEKEHLSFKEKLRLNSRLYFTLKYAGTILRSRKLAQRKEYDTQAWIDSSLEIFDFIEDTGGKFHITGLENITKSEKPVLFISNHMSTLETMIFPGIIAPRRNVTFVVKESLVSHPFFGDVMRSRSPIVVSRKDPRKDFEAVMNGGMKLLSKGNSIVIFPEGTRHIDFNPAEFNSIGVKLAKKAGVQVVPIAIKTDFWGIGKLIKELAPIDRHKPIHIKFGEPFPVSGNGKEDNQKVIDFIQNAKQEWG